MRVVHLTGTIDYNTACATREQLLMELTRDDLHIDFTDVKQVDSSCLATLVEIFQIARQSGRELQLVHVSGDFRKLMRLARLEDIFS